MLLGISPEVIWFNRKELSWVWLKIQQEGSSRFWSMFPLTRTTHFGTAFLRHSHFWLDPLGFDSTVCEAPPQWPPPGASVPSLAEKETGSDMWVTFFPNKSQAVSAIQFSRPSGFSHKEPWGKIWVWVQQDVDRRPGQAILGLPYSWPTATWPWRPHGVL